MALNQKTIYVYESFNSDESNLMGRLYVGEGKGSDSFSFEFDANWLVQYDRSCIIDPELQFYSGRQYPVNKSIFGIFADSSPDRWGRVLMQRRERIYADKEGRKPRKLTDGDYLLGVYDETRMGAIRFKEDENGAFLSDDKETAAPPWATLRTLEEASRNFENEENLLNEKWLNQLLKPGSSLGGARPKATIQDTNGELWIAKFPSKNDEFNTGAWEKVAHDLAKLCSLNVPESKLETFSKLGSTFIVKRFDRDGDKRIHFASAMTMLGKTDGASSSDGSSYLDIAGFI
ncbi:MAG: type II toxin-antitoxin system HipA family toxin, partial [Ruminococcaceae bacterium]|nr:type II toxin-antitoxin system HipA family toxin [Oscillospiraceae bacterium]